MRPISLFDKSFLQSLNASEAMWFDHLFLANICPIFYVETLADLEKEPGGGRTPENEVRIISDKFPEMHGAPNIHHRSLVINDLMGHAISMSGSIYVAGGKVGRVDAKAVTMFEHFPEATAFSRWQDGNFLEVERTFARVWREQMANLELKSLLPLIKKLQIEAKSCRSLKESCDLARLFIEDPANKLTCMKLIIFFQKLEQDLATRIFQRWESGGSPPISQFAPYAAYVLMVDLFFLISLAASQISVDRPSNRMDIGYLFYLPFAMMFVSSDRLHQRCAPLFLRDDQSFVWGLDLKRDLGAVNSYFMKLPDNEKEKGVMSFAPIPPKGLCPLVDSLYDKYLIKDWRNVLGNSLINKKENGKEVAKRIHSLVDAIQDAPHDPSLYLSEEPDCLIIKRKVHKERAGWFQLPKDMSPSKGENS